MPLLASAGLPATVFSAVLATVMVGSGLLFDRMAAAPASAPVQVALLDRPPPARVERLTAPWEEISTGYPGVLSEPVRPLLRQMALHENTPVRAVARRGDKIDKKKPMQAVFGPQTNAAEPMAPPAGFTP